MKVRTLLATAAFSAVCRFAVAKEYNEGDIWHRTQNDEKCEIIERCEIIGKNAKNYLMRNIDKEGMFIKGKKDLHEELKQNKRMTVTTRDYTKEPIPSAVYSQTTEFTATRNWKGSEYSYSFQDLHRLSLSQQLQLNIVCVLPNCAVDMRNKALWAASQSGISKSSFPPNARAENEIGLAFIREYEYGWYVFTARRKKLTVDNETFWVFEDKTVRLLSEFELPSEGMKDDYFYGLVDSLKINKPEYYKFRSTAAAPKRRDAAKLREDEVKLREDEVKRREDAVKLREDAVQRQEEAAAAQTQKEAAAAKPRERAPNRTSDAAAVTGGDCDCFSGSGGGCSVM